MASVSYTHLRGNVMALKGVDLEIYVGDILSIVGQNGSGKTTLVRHCNGLLRPTSGKVDLMGEDTTGQTVAQMSRRCGYGCQNPNHQIFCTTVREELMVAPKNFGFSEQAVSYTHLSRHRADEKPAEHERITLQQVKQRIGEQQHPGTASQSK